jgi:hypothetical protein
LSFDDIKQLIELTKGSGVWRGFVCDPSELECRMSCPCCGDDPDSQGGLCTCDLIAWQQHPAPQYDPAEPTIEEICAAYDHPHEYQGSRRCLCGGVRH